MYNPGHTGQASQAPGAPAMSTTPPIIIIHHLDIFQPSHPSISFLTFIISYSNLQDRVDRVDIVSIPSLRPRLPTLTDTQPPLSINGLGTGQYPRLRPITWPHSIRQGATTPLAASIAQELSRSIEPSPCVCVLADPARHGQEHCAAPDPAHRAGHLLARHLYRSGLSRPPTAGA